MTAINTEYSRTFGNQFWWYSDVLNSSFFIHTLLQTDVHTHTLADYNSIASHHLHLFPRCLPPVTQPWQLWQLCEWKPSARARATLNRCFLRAPSLWRVTLNVDLPRSEIVFVVPPHSLPEDMIHPPPYGILSLVRFPWEAKGFSVCYLQTRKSCCCARVRRRCSLKLSP